MGTLEEYGDGWEKVLMLARDAATCNGCGHMRHVERCEVVVGSEWTLAGDTDIPCQCMHTDIEGKRVSSEAIFVDDEVSWERIEELLDQCRASRDETFAIRDRARIKAGLPDGIGGRGVQDDKVRELLRPAVKRFYALVISELVVFTLLVDIVVAVTR